MSIVTGIVALTEAKTLSLTKTPTLNKNLPQRLADFSTLTEGLEYAAQGVTGFNFYSGRGVLEHVLSYADLRRRALVLARKLMSTGLQRLGRVAIVAETGPDFIITFFACQYAGLVPCPIPYSMYIGGREAYEQRIAGMLRAADAHAVVAPADQVDSIRVAAAIADVNLVLTHDELAAKPESISRLQGFGPSDVAYIQYSSGSTSAPKGVLITQSSIMANAHGILAFGNETKPTDRGCSWLPLYHDMGLVGFCISPMLSQSSLDYLATTAFARRPGLWLKLISDNRCTISFSPSFGYDLAARRLAAGDIAQLDLSCWRNAGIGGDMVRSDVLRRFAEAMAPARLAPNVFLPSYGMAEFTLAMTFPKAGSALKVDYVDGDAIKAQRAVSVAADVLGARGFVVCGRIMAGHELHVRGPDGALLGEREVGVIYVKGPSLMAGYFHDAAATAECIGADGFLNTGDMGYLLDGEIVITGRVKDLILHNGRNIWPQDIEWAAEKYNALKSGDVAAFAVEYEDGNDEVVVLVECRLQDAVTQNELRRDVGKLVHQGSGVDCTIVLVAPKSLPFTSSGKLSRTAARAKYLSGEMTLIAPASA